MTVGLDLDSALEVGARATSTLGLDGAAGELDALRGFLEGPVVLAVIGTPGTGRNLIADGLRRSRPSLRVETLALAPSHPLQLWDALVMVTPADRALSRNEEDLVRRARLRGREAAVAVTGCDRLGDPGARARAETEIRTLRLEPALGGLGVPGFFCAQGEYPESLGMHLGAVLPVEPRAAHESVGLHELACILESACTQLGARVETCERERARLRGVESHVPRILAYLQEARRLACLTVEDALRTQFERLRAAADATVRAAVGWISGMGEGDWTDVERPLRRAWGDVVAGALRACEPGRHQLTAELERRAREVNEAGEELQLTARLTVVVGEWSSPELREAASGSGMADRAVTPVLTRLHEEASRELKRVRTLTEEAKGGLAESTKARLRIASGHVTGLIQGSFDTRATEVLTTYLEDVAGPKLRHLIEVAGEVAQGQARESVESFGVSLQSVVAEWSRSLAERHAWGEAYRDLLKVNTWAQGHSGG